MFYNVKNAESIILLSTIFYAVYSGLIIFYIGQVVNSILKGKVDVNHTLSENEHSLEKQNHTFEEMQVCLENYKLSFEESQLCLENYKNSFEQSQLCLKNHEQTLENKELSLQKQKLSFILLHQKEYELNSCAIKGKDTDKILNLENEIQELKTVLNLNGEWDTRKNKKVNL